VESEIVHDGDVAWSQGRDEDLVDLLPEGLAIDRAIDDSRRLDAIMPKGACCQRPCGIFVGCAGLTDPAA
jgi:hypothetical protein